MAESDQAIYKDASRSPQERADDLLARMTADEKIGQTVQLFGWQTYRRAGETVELEASFVEAVRRGEIGALYGTLRADPWTKVTLETGLSPRAGAEAVNRLQRCAIEQSRLGIPLIIGEECSHGHMAIGATVFPVPLTIGSTWNTELYARMCRAVALETRSQGGSMTYSPVLDVVRDPRWGRTEENFAEDPYLVGVFGETAVRSMQGERLDGLGSIGVTLKHYVAYGATEGGRNGAPAHIGMRELHEIDLEPFRRAVLAGAMSVMPAYNEVDGIPCTSNRYLLTDVLRKQWGFDGFVITDCGAINMLHKGHNVAEDGAHASALSMRAGVDMEMSGVMFAKHLKGALERGLITTAELDAAVRAILIAKLRLGLFEQPYADPERAAQVIGSDAHRGIAREVAAEGAVLLKNERAALPLAPSLRKLAVIGPNADRGYHQLGDYTSPQPPGRVATVLDGLRAQLEPSGCDVRYAPGCRVRGQSREGFEQALACAADAEAIVLVLGGSSGRDFGEGSIDLRTGASVVTGNAEHDMDCGEGIDRAALALSGVQLELAQAIRELDKPLIVVYINGRPIVEPWIDAHADAILEAWYPGQEGGHAIADLLLGRVNPSGKLTVSIPRHAGQVPLVYNNKRTRGRYLETDMSPRYPFGHGLSYTTFEYGELRLGAAEIAADGVTEAVVEVTNTGAVAGAEVVQLYVTDVIASFARPERELKGFVKVQLQPGERATVRFALGAEQLQMLDRELRPVVEPGEFVIRVGGSSASGREAALRVSAG
ncbi:glycoside hydrolase family 3 C-terminal domain-containing protein [Paenibacillus sp. IB182496]|uniref:Glycoside hydrolase family 3 C-terminal domain-containing protein n=1 Tax=Paenibacillus sabuli TaxID=2772509 RepID=A0A927BSI3_9BACL|nr:glycoside hydrolase family 3 N-terminal domain-containing protein [Paenibacillus sabuli]MBD2845968.1 glycoside hydrolase family 3 C-terminal domain-containing protein [Paenibacillus sabuli]